MVSGKGGDSPPRSASPDSELGLKPAAEGFSKGTPTEAPVGGAKPWYRSRKCVVGGILCGVFWLAVIITGAVLLASYINGKPKALSSDSFACTSGCYSEADIAEMNEPWNRVLSQNVATGSIDGVALTVVDYANVDTGAGSDLAIYLATLAEMDLTRVTESEAIALLINAYNAFTVDLIAKNLDGLTSITELSTQPFPRTTWNTHTFTLGGNSVTLDDVEHGNIRGRFDEPRIHAAVNCASVSCPDLRAEAYNGAMLDQQLEEQTALWLTNTGKGLRLDREANVLYLSRLFSWYGGDFDPPGIEEFACQYAGGDVCEYLAANDVRTAFLDYNWNLNSRTAATLMEGSAVAGGGRLAGSDAGGELVTGGSMTGGSGANDAGSMTGGSGNTNKDSVTGGSPSNDNGGSTTGSSGGSNTGDNEGALTNGDADTADAMHSVADITQLTQPWNSVLSRHVRNGEIDGVPLTAVDYASIDLSPEGELATFLDSLASLDMSKVPESEMLALLINAYNAFTVQLIASNREGLGSILELSTEPSPATPWNTHTFTLGGESITLDELEHTRIRGEYDEPRIHAAVNCAAVSCPDLRAEAYSGAMLDEQLEEQTALWLNNPEKGLRLDREANVLYLSTLFSWYGVDFDPPGIEEFACRYVDSVCDYLAANDVSTSFMGYNWALNTQATATLLTAEGAAVSGNSLTVLSATPSPTPAPTPEPTPAPTPEPTPSPTPAPTPSPTSAPATSSGSVTGGSYSYSG